MGSKHLVILNLTLQERFNPAVGLLILITAHTLVVYKIGTYRDV